MPVYTQDWKFSSNTENINNWTVLCESSLPSYIVCFCFMFGLWGNCIFIVAASRDFLREKCFHVNYSFCRFTELCIVLMTVNKVIAQDLTFLVWWHDLYSTVYWAHNYGIPHKWLLKRNSRKMPGCKFHQWRDEFKSGKSNASTVLWVLNLSVLPQARTDSINLTWWSLRPRTILNNQPRQSDRLIYREHDTDVTTLFIFSLCQCIKMQGVFAMPW